MTKKQALEILKSHQAWRMGMDIPPVDGLDLSNALDKAIEALTDKK